MQLEKVENIVERDLIFGLLFSDKVCRNIAHIVRPNLLSTDYGQHLARWAVRYWNEFKTPIKSEITSVVASETENMDSDLAENINWYLAKLLERAENVKINEDYTIKTSLQYIKALSIKDYANKIVGNLNSDKLEEAEKLIIEYKIPEKEETKTVDFLNSESLIISDIYDDSDVLLDFRGAYGAVMGKIHREDFLGVLAPMKAGKTWLLIDIGSRALRESLNVIHISLEMSEKEMIKRYLMCLCNQSVYAVDNISFPYFAEFDDGYMVKHKIVTRKGFDKDLISSELKRLKRQCKGALRLLSVPAYSLSPDSLEVELERLIYVDGFNPDVVIVDYADIMKADLHGDYRNQIDHIWKKLRGLAQKYKCAVFTASQAGRNTIGGDAGAKDVAEDIRKFAHVTCMVSINQTQKERENGVVRLKQLGIRGGAAEYRTAYCTQCLDSGQMILDSRFEDEMCKNNSDETETKKPYKKGVKKYD